MRALVVKPALVCALWVGAAAPAWPQSDGPPLPSGTYVFRHRYAEHPGIKSFTVLVKLRGRKISIINPHKGQAFPAGVLSEGLLVWNVHARQWTIASDEAERHAQDVGGCSDGPEVIDIRHRIYWTC